jgi:type IV pilus assembly protein PilF
MKRLSMVLLLVLSACAATASKNAADASNRHRAKIYTDLGSGYYEQGLMANALDAFNEAARIDPDYALPYSGLGLVHASLKQDEEARESFRHALQLDPKSSEAHNNYGTFLCSRGYIDESITEFLAAVKNPLYPTPELAYLNAGTCAEKKKDDKNAEIYLTRALQLQPGLRQASYQLAKLYFGREDYFQARKFLQQAMLNIDATPEMLWLGVRIEHQLGGSDAESSYRMLLKNKYPDSEQTRAMLSGE